MQHKTQITPSQQLAGEMLEIFLSCYILRRNLSDSEDATENPVTIKVTALLVNDVATRLCKFRDDDSRSMSFRQAQKSLAKHAATSERAKNAEPLIRRFLSLTKSVETYRNDAVAHLLKRGTAHLRPLTGLYESVPVAAQIIDVLSGESVEYLLGQINLRSTVGA